MENQGIQYKVVVVDDEEIAVQGVCRLIEKYCPSYMVVGTAENGKDALEVIRRVTPDVVLIDVEMPMMSGLQVIQEARKENENLCFLVISGYQEFDYALEAMRSGVLDYLTKPIVPGKFTATMEKVEKKLDNIYYEKRNRIFHKLCRGDAVVIEDMYRFYPHERYYAALLRENGLPRRYSSAKEMEIYGTRDEAFSVYGRDNMEELFLIPEKMLGDQTLKEYINKVKLRQLGEKSYSTTLYYSRSFSRLEIPEKIRDLYYWLDTVSTIGLSQFVDLEKRHREAAADTEKDRRDVLQLVHEVSGYIEKGNSRQLHMLLEKTFEKWEEQHRPQLWVEQVMRRIVDVVRMYGNSTESLTENEYQFEDAFFYSADMHELLQNMEELFRGAMLEGKDNPKADSEAFFERVREYLTVHMKDQISLQELSDHFAISQGYMSKLFRKYTQQSYHQFITALRMEKARQLLEGENKLYIREVAEMVGYRDQFYFSRVFHSYFSMSPTDCGEA